VASIAPRGYNAALVTLRDGREVRLEDSHDVSEDNSGVLVLEGPESKPRYVAWDDITTIRFEW